MALPAKLMPLPHKCCRSCLQPQQQCIRLHGAKLHQPQRHAPARLSSLSAPKPPPVGSGSWIASNMQGWHV